MASSPNLVRAAARAAARVDRQRDAMSKAVDDCNAAVVAAVAAGHSFREIGSACGRASSWVQQVLAAESVDTKTLRRSGPKKVASVASVAKKKTVAKKTVAKKKIAASRR